MTFWCAYECSPIRPGIAEDHDWARECGEFLRRARATQMYPLKSLDPLSIFEEISFCDTRKLIR